MQNKMFFLTLILFFMLAQQVSTSPVKTDHCIVFVHIGKTLPDHLSIAITQARSFNDGDIVLIANKDAARNHHSFFLEQRVTLVPCEELPKTPSHEIFLKKNKFGRESFWRYASERFFYLHDFMAHHDIKNVVHLENDVMLYVDIKELLPLFLHHYPTIGATFDGDRCIAGFVYIADKKAMHDLTQFMVSIIDKKLDDMFAIAAYRETCGPTAIRALPIIHDTYIQTQKIQNHWGKTFSEKDLYCNNVEKFNAVFDAVSFGQYLGGVDSTDPHTGPGFVNLESIFNSSLLTYVWERDERGRNIPYAIFQGKKLRINNLHIHSKKLELFVSYDLYAISKNESSFNDPMYFVTAADTEHYPWVVILLKSIVEHNKNKEISVLVFDLGLLREEIEIIESHYKAKVCPLEQVHPDLTKKFVVRPNGRLSRGWFAWKPVVLKQAFDHFPYFLYLDSGKKLMKPSDDIFHVIKEQGYFLFDCGHAIDPMTTTRVKNKFNLNTPENNWILPTFGVDAGIQGLSRKVYEDYVKPMYELAHEIQWFEDDGTAPWGFGGGRHDQTLFSILARLQSYVVYKVCGNGPTFFAVNGKKIIFRRNDYFQYKCYDDNPRAIENKLL